MRFNEPFTKPPVDFSEIETASVTKQATKLAERICLCCTNECWIPFPLSVSNKCWTTFGKLRCLVIIGSDGFLFTLEIELVQSFSLQRVDFKIRTIGDLQNTES